MAIKIYFSNQIHRISKLPTSLPALFAHIATLFKSDLPAFWSLQYVDSDGDQIVVSHEHDFQELLILESATPATTLKLHVVPSKEGESSISSIKYAPEEPAKYPDFEEYEVISQNNEEKPAIADTHPQEKPEILVPEVSEVKLQPARKDSKEYFKKAIELVKLLAKGKYPETERNNILNELNVMKANLADDQIRKVDQKLTEVEEKIAAKQARQSAKEAKEVAKKAKKDLVEATLVKIEEPRKEEEKENKQKKSQEKRKPFEFSKFVRVLAAMNKTQKEGKAKKADEFQEKLFKLVPEHAKAALTAMLSVFSQDLEKDAIEACYFEEMRKFIEENFPEEKERILQELEQMKQKRIEQRDQIQAKQEDKRKKHQEEKTELIEKYSKVVFQKAAVMKMVFVNEKVSTLCEYVSQKPGEASMEDLVLNYRK